MTVPIWLRLDGAIGRARLRFAARRMKARRAQKRERLFTRAQRAWWRTRFFPRRRHRPLWVVLDERR